MIRRRAAKTPAIAIRRPPRRRGGRGVLTVVAGFLVASALLRLGDGTGAAIAREIGAIGSSTPAAATAETPAVDVLLSALREREKRLAAAEAALAEREQAVVLAEEEVRRGLAAMTEAEAGLKDLLTLADSAAEDDLARLTAMYEAMKPAEASALFDQMEPNFAAGFLGRMRADAAAQVLAGLPPEKAYALSVVLAGRNASVLRQ